MAPLPVQSLRRLEVYRALDTSPEGLSAQEVKARQSLYGLNLLAEPQTIPAWRKWIRYNSHLMALLLWFAAVSAFITGHFTEGAVIVVVVLLNATFSFWREYRAGKAVSELKKLLPPYARIVRDGSEAMVPASEIVPGDVLILSEGDNIPADARIVEEYGLRTNNATLTGETVPSVKTAEASFRDDLTEVEQPNLIFTGTSVVSGTGRAVVYATGMMTQFGRIANLTVAAAEETSLLQQQLKHTTRVLSLIALGIGGLVFLIALTDVGMPWSEAFLLATGIIVAVIPEGLVPTLTLTLAMAVQRLAQHGILVKKLAITETLGNISVICTDKSGTLTQNQMTVRYIWVAGRSMEVSGVGYDPTGEFKPSLNTIKNLDHGSDLRDINDFFTAAMLCNNSRINPPTPENPKWTSLGDQTEASLRVLAIKGGLNETVQERLYPRIHELPFDARRKRMSTIHRCDGTETAFIKGAPKEILNLCTHIQKEGQILSLDNTTRKEILGVYDEYARSALRVLALARRELPPRHSEYYTPESVEHDMVFLGLAAMMDPPRPEVARAMNILHKAGIRIVMITGDYGLTADSLARRVGMTQGPSRIITGSDLDGMTGDELRSSLGQQIIFARMAPEHKLRLVEAYQSMGEVVAVIGDGVNDAPALRKADVGIAMGIVGTDVAKEAANVILMQDDFGAVAKAIEEGRAVYNNLRKFMTYIFASNVPEILPFLLTSIFKFPLALTVKQILAIDLGTDIIPALALGMEKPEPDVMLRPPRRRNEPLVDQKLFLRSFAWLGMIETVLCYTGFFMVYHGNSVLYQSGLPLLQKLFFSLSAPAGADVYLLAITVYQAGVVMAQVGNAFACRTERSSNHKIGWFSNPLLLFGVGFEIFLVILMVYFGPLVNLMNHQSLPPAYWILLALNAPILYGLEKLRKSLFNTLQKPVNKLTQGGNK
jgi:P-type Ca2+ transporter type 2C